MKSVNHRKIGKKQFEEELILKYTTFEYRPYDDLDEKHIATRLYLYYKNGKHIATWDKGKREGWEFE